jgi:hypothetical protein
MDGYEVTAAIREREQVMGLARVPILALTASAFREDIAQCLNAGCDGHVAKPMSKQMLIASIRAHLPKGMLPPVASAQGPEGASSQTGEDETKLRVVIDPDLADIVPDYLSNRNSDVTLLQAALEIEEFLAIRTIGHNMKGTGAAYGFEKLSEIGSALEQAGKTMNASLASDNTEKLEIYLQSLEIVFH